MDQSVTNEELLADMRTLNQEHVPTGYPCVQTWQIDRLVEMIDIREQEAVTLHTVIRKYRNEARVMRTALESIAETTGSADPCRKHVDTARMALGPVSGLTNDQKAIHYYKTAAMQGRTGFRPLYVPCRVKLNQRVSGDFPVGHASQVGPGEFDCTANQYGAVSVIAEDGKTLGLRMDEFEPTAWAENKKA